MSCQFISNYISKILLFDEICWYIYNFLPTHSLRSSTKCSDLSFFNYYCFFFGGKFVKTKLKELFMVKNSFSKDNLVISISCLIEKVIKNQKQSFWKLDRSYRDFDMAWKYVNASFSFLLVISTQRHN